MYADHIFTNAAVWQPLGMPPATSVAVSDGTIVAIGSDAVSYTHLTLPTNSEV